MSRKPGIPVLLGSGLALLGLIAPAVGSEPDPVRDEAAVRRAAVRAQLSDEQRRAVEEFAARFGRDQAPIQVTSVAGRAPRVVPAGDRTLQSAVAKRNADGTWSVSCVEHSDQFAEFLIARPAAEPAADSVVGPPAARVEAKEQ